MCALSILLLIFLFILTFITLQWFCKQRKRNDVVSVAFFHPYCNAGGGGERVLWCAIKALQERHGATIHCVVYTGDTDASPQEILAKAGSRFNITLPHSVEFVFLKHRRFVEAKLYPYFTLIGQTFGGFLLGCEALYRYVPTVFIDSMGYAATLPLFRIVGGCQVACYVHYPTISTDMIEMVSSRAAAYNNTSSITRSSALTGAKLVYYKLFARLYGIMGRSAHVIMVNSSWTYDHIVRIWQQPARTTVVYPPCDIKAFVAIENRAEQLLRDGNECRIVSIGQFRPEKNHDLQLKALKSALDRLRNTSSTNQLSLRLILIGGLRNDEDFERVEKLRASAVELQIDNAIEWKINASFEQLGVEVSRAMFCLHTMWNEHFGIGIVEGMASGTIVVAHNSGGPKMDIVSDFEGRKTGFLSSTADEYAEALVNVLNMTVQERNDIRAAAKAKSNEFSTEKFEERFLECMSGIL